MSQSNSLEQYVANRYLHEMTNAGYQPVCHEVDAMLDDALSAMAALNKASQFIRQNIANRQAGLKQV